MVQQAYYYANGFLHYVLKDCVFTSADLPDIEYIHSYYHNKVELLRFNSTVGKFVGYTEFGVMNAENWNKDPSYMAVTKAQKEIYCKHNIDIRYESALDKSAKPCATLSSATPPAGGRHTAMLMCSVYDFYPSNIHVVWLRDGQEVTSDVTATDELANGDWYYQIHSQLEYTPRSGEKISCMVHHASLQAPLVKDWDPSLPESERNKIAIGASGLVLGLVLSLAGFIYYRRKVTGQQVSSAAPCWRDLLQGRPPTGGTSCCFFSLHGL
ncbi:H-2 class II histocompatibility antigen, E-S beta chain-like [Diretmus argenteus]